jgi:hypothetical protein
MEILTTKEAIMIQSCIEAVVIGVDKGIMSLSGGFTKEDLENLLKKLGVSRE